MYVGSLEIRLLIRESRSLKDKRQVVKSILDRLRNGFNVSAAEVDARDHRQLAVLGVAMIGEEAGHVKGVLEQIANALRRHPVAEFVSCQSSVVNADELA
jgi:uncharacterized protein YlxP (DUF503 family)